MAIPQHIIDNIHKEVINYITLMYGSDTVRDFMRFRVIEAVSRYIWMNITGILGKEREHIVISKEQRRVLCDKAIKAYNESGRVTVNIPEVKELLEKEYEKYDVTEDERIIEYLREARDYFDDVRSKRDSEERLVPITKYLELIPEQYHPYL